MIVNNLIYIICYIMIFCIYNNVLLLGNQPYVKANGEDIAVLNAVEAITYCLEDRNCKDLPFNL